MAASKPAKITITKIEGARRQIEAAAALWFEDGDPVVIHTLAAAGHHVCHDIVKSRGQKSMTLFNSDFFPRDEWKAHKKITVALENFLKHAEHDPNPSTKITFSEESTELYILDGIFLWHMIEGGKHSLFEAFCAWFFLSRPNFFKDTFCVLLKSVVIEPNLSRSEFLAKYIKEHVKSVA